MTDEIRKSAIPLVRWNYTVRPGDRHDVRMHKDAHTVVAEHSGHYVREVATFTSKSIAIQVASELNNWSGCQIR